MLTNILSTRFGVVLSTAAILTLAGQAVAFGFPVEFQHFCGTFTELDK